MACSQRVQPRQLCYLVVCWFKSFVFYVFLKAFAFPRQFEPDGRNKGESKSEWRKTRRGSRDLGGLWPARHDENYRWARRISGVLSHCSKRLWLFHIFPFESRFEFLKIRLVMPVWPALVGFFLFKFGESSDCCVFGVAVFPGSTILCSLLVGASGCTLFPSTYIKNKSTLSLFL